MTKDPEWYECKSICNWQDLLHWYNDLCKESECTWIFRGQGDASWELNTSLERVAIDRWKYKYDDLPKIECSLLRDFRRKAYHYLVHEIAEKDLMQWFALIQHHGGPTRLLDWTYSFYVAVYFAVESIRSGNPCAVWAINHDSLRDEVKKFLPDEVKRLIDHDPNAKAFETVRGLFNSSSGLVYPLNPLYMNERLILQQGIFLAPGDITKSFMSNLREVVDKEPRKIKVVKLEICCDPKFLKEVVIELRRMNISRATLFPGLDGLAENLKNLICESKFIASD